MEIRSQQSLSYVVHASSVSDLQGRKSALFVLHFCMVCTATQIAWQVLERYKTFANICMQTFSPTQAFL